MPVITHNDLALLTAGKRAFSNPDWLFEPKYDGFRVLVLKEAGKVCLLPRQGRDMAWRFPNW